MPVEISVVTCRLSLSSSFDTSRAPSCVEWLEILSVNGADIGPYVRSCRTCRFKEGRVDGRRNFCYHILDACEKKKRKTKAALWMNTFFATS